jgi:catechol 2,3-dioxygenase
VFASFGRYHHHLAYNLWRGRGVPPAAPQTVGLRHWTLELADPAELERVSERLSRLGADVEASGSGLLTRDPGGIAVRLFAAPAL